MPRRQPMNDRQKPIHEVVEEITQLDLSEQPEAFSKLHDQLDLELNRADTDSEAQ